MLQKQQPDPDWTLHTAGERTERRIGKELAEKYRDIRPLLALMDYRFIKDAEKNGDWESCLIYTLYYDTLRGKKPFSQALISAAGAALWAAAKIKYAFRKKAGTRLAFSNTFLFSKRYPTVREQVEKKAGCTAVLTFYDLVRVYNGSLRDGLKEALKLDAGSVRPVFIPRRSISGGKLQQAAAGFYELLCREGGIPETEMDAALARMRKE